jgi:hypothetical protein
VLHFDGQGPVVKHRDYYNHVERREPPLLRLVKPSEERQFTRSCSAG